MMKLFVHAVGAWVAAEAASGRYSRPVAMGLTLLVSRLGTPTAALAIAGYALKRLDEAGVFAELKAVPARDRKQGERRVHSTQRG